MFKKIIICVGALTLISVLLFGGAAFSHLKGGVSWIQGQVEENVPVDYELDRARQLIEDTGPEVKKCKRLIAQKQVEIRYLEQSIGMLEEAQERSNNRLESLHAALQQEQVSYTFGARTVSRRAVEHDASKELRRAKAQRSMLNSKRKQMEALGSSLTFAQEKLENVKTERTKLGLLVQELEAKLHQTEAMKAATSDFNLDSSSLAKANKILERCRRRLDVTQQMIENEYPLVDEVPTVVPTGREVSDQISEFLGVGASETDVELQVPSHGSPLVPVRKI